MFSWTFEGAAERPEHRSGLFGGNVVDFGISLVSLRHKNKGRGELYGALD